MKTKATSRKNDAKRDIWLPQSYKDMMAKYWADKLYAILMEKNPLTHEQTQED